MRQLDLFITNEPKEVYQYPWQPFFAWMPKVGGLAQMHSVVIDGYGYCYGDQVRINAIEGEDVTCTVESQWDKHFWKNGTVYQCKKSDLWPLIYRY
jgi:hypothetical protein